MTSELPLTYNCIKLSTGIGRKSTSTRSGIIWIKKIFMFVLISMSLCLLLRLQTIQSFLNYNKASTIQHRIYNIKNGYEEEGDSINSSTRSSSMTISNTGLEGGRDIDDTNTNLNTASTFFRPLVISGPSGVGKGTLIDKLVKHYNNKIHEAIDSHEFKQEGYDADDSGNTHDIFAFSVSHTTRNPRPGEIDGVHYHFTTREDIQERIKYDEFIEYAEVHGNIYGTSSQSVQNVIASHKICILDIDIQGVKKVKENNSSFIQTMPHFIFIAPPSMEILEQRLRDRKTETEEAILRRIGNAQSEVEYGTAPGNFDYVIVNDDLETAFLQLRGILEEWYPNLLRIPSPSYEF